ncbi:aspartate/glutamate racemase family protein [Cohnella lubricantis]|uniref:Aspartate/glutamate racemase family protein n=1 Tax=Cohnella lubricantis TaxID=2163172 RepID=A0A841TFA4_9BACL|nr:aspartate/glutamate racemase family protein [Cohnella lubricantis]MBB6677151.1 aspartate/glutamate racemase family protein [Cohnella lubricantis]MBP2117038.1 maleate isomerase [Cohnella lubricantis]
MVRIGMLTPSSNTVLEPITAKLLEDAEGVSAHFSRLRVTAIALDGSSDDQFAEVPMLAAASLLADANVNLLVWNGTSGSWLGLERDAELCARIEQETGIRTTTSSQALKEAYERLGVKRLALVTPYTADVNERIANQYEGLGIQCAASLCCGIRVNEQFANVPAAKASDMIEEAIITSRPDAVAVVCTNMNAAAIAAAAERQYGIPVLDSVSVTAWQALRMTGVGTEPLADRWGRIFRVR